MSQQNNSGSDPSSNIFFSGNQNYQNNQENQIDSKFQNRQDNFITEEDFSKIKESAMSKDLSLSENNRNKIFLQKRLQKQINMEPNISLMNSLSMSKDAYKQLNSEEIQPSDFKKIINSFTSQNIDDKFKGLMGIRKLLSIEPVPPIQEIIDLKLVPEIIKYLDNYPNEFKYEALWSLSNIATGNEEQVNTILINGGLPKVMNLLDSNIEEIKTQAIWLIGNMVSDSNKIRDIIIEYKIFDKILTILASTNIEKYITTSTWCISNFFKTKPIPNYEISYKAFKIIAKVAMIYGAKDKDNIEFITDLCFIFSFMTKNYKEFINEIIDANLLPTIISFLDINNKGILLTCLRTIGNVVLGNANQTQKIIDLNVLDKLKYTLFNENSRIRTESAFIISNIAAGTQKQIETLIDQNFLQILSKIFRNDVPQVKNEAIFGIANLTSVENELYMKKLVDDGILIIIFECMKTDVAKYIAISLEALANILSFGKKKGELKFFVNEIEKMGMFDILEKLQSHENDIIYQKTLQILENYFDTENC